MNAAAAFFQVRRNMQVLESPSFLFIYQDWDRANTCQELRPRVQSDPAIQFVSQACSTRGHILGCSTSFTSQALCREESPLANCQEQQFVLG